MISRLFEEKELTAELVHEYETHLVEQEGFTRPLEMDELWEMNVHASGFDEET